MNTAILTDAEEARAHAQYARGCALRDHADQIADPLRDLRAQHEAVRDFIGALHALLAVEKARSLALGCTPSRADDVLRARGLLRDDHVAAAITALREGCN